MDDIANLITEEVYQDKSLNIKSRRTKQQVFCKVKSVTRSEFYSASTAGLTPEIEMTISHSIDYNDQKLVEFHNRTYKVLRTYWDGDEVTLTLGESIATGVSA